ncbi:THUMP-like domain-containing protein [Abyssalbus ytuae]|uniref:Class I SAM-dependent methyltransferase n=1 Tax=Abyssalbus ytuae TaxID=2926907 RepID=A0A9E7D1I9_9FLAO|nr:class I SAM-dependent methyltransferase [Abyssalbus ytuae]UOB17153.1 class I SAM-dependent methyltransferase [Abyssalbus ytuae]
MNKNILNTDIQIFINENLNTDISSLLLKKVSFEGVSLKEVVWQIEAKKKCKKKLSIWYNTPKIYFPNKLNIEQTSSQITARYKSNLVDGKTLVDITGGFGIDSYFFSKKINKVTHCEIDENLSAIVQYNNKILNVKNIETVPENGLRFLKESNLFYDWIYIDPSRRNDIKGKVFRLEDCLPQVPENLDFLFEHSNNILIKTSPLLDLSIGTRELKFVKQIHIIAVNNDVKEELWVLDKNYKGDIEIITVNLKKDEDEKFSFYLTEEKNACAEYTLPKSFLYEPNSAILKSGAFNLISKKLNIGKLHQHSHLYTSEVFTSNFPGRSFKIIQVLPYQKKILKENFKITKANITTRNFPENVAGIRKKLKIKEGGDIYLFFTTLMNEEKSIIICNKIH